MDDSQNADAVVNGSDQAPPATGVSDQAPPATGASAGSAHDVGPDGRPPEDLIAQAVDGALDEDSLLASLAAVITERDSHLADLQRITAEFSNFRRQATKRQTDTVQHAASGLVAKLLPVLDACDAAVLQGATDVEPVHAALLETLRKEGLEVLTDAGELFDPERHEAVMHDDGDGGAPTVAEIMRSGYVWNGRVLRPAMVKVRG